MLIALTMPQFGESITQARIVHWLKKEGDAVAEQEPLVEMETEKSVFSYESPFKGRLVKILEQDDAEAPVGKEIAEFEVSEEDGKKYLSLGIGKKVDSSRREPSVRPEPSGATPKGAAGAETSFAPPPEQPAPASSKLAPLIRALAKEHGISLGDAEKIPGTGPGGRVTKDDLIKFVSGRGLARQTPTAATPMPPVERPGVTSVPLAPIRARIAENMVLSKKTIPHAGCSVDVDLKLIDTWRSGQEKAPSYVIFAIVAVIKALKSHPLINSAFKEKEGRHWIETYEHVNMGIAVATEQGLMVPVMRNAQKLSFREVEKEMVRLVEGGRKGTLKVEDLTGATITVNNTGAVGAVRTQQIVPPGQSSIIAFNKVVKRPWAVGDKIEVRPIMGLDIAFDHRLIDGNHAGRFLTEVAKNLENFDFSQIG
ncbi:MAG TPA: dihydrolipoamide acetyltransferase family protein [bacterium]|nr:dihydrolipoamide acetyltransferase family protein [bacterium]